jgi:hypothetical protein
VSWWLGVRYHGSRLPGLRHLDLSRNEPGRLGRHHLGGEIDAYDLLARLDARTRLVRLRMPSLRTQGQSDRFAATLAELPQLRDVSIARRHDALTHVTVPRQVAVPRPWPWPPPDLAYGTLALAGTTVPLSVLLLVLESEDPGERDAVAAWDAVLRPWEPLRRVAFTLPARTIARALAFLPDAPELAELAELQPELSRSPDAAVDVVFGLP